MNNQPLVTIGIPTRNRVEYLKEALESVLFQSYSNIEIIVSDNQSSDQTQEYLASIQDSRIKVFRHEVMLEMVDNWNFCLESSSGEYFLLLSDDDVLEKNCIEILLNSFLYNKNIAFSYGSVKIVYNNTEKVAKYPREKNIKSVKNIILAFFNSSVVTYACCMLFRKTHIRYNKNLRYLFDAYFWMENVLYFNTGPFWTNEIVAKYRKHQTSETVKSKKIDWIRDDLMIFDLLSLNSGLHKDIKQTLRICRTDYIFLYEALQKSTNFINFFRNVFIYKPKIQKVLIGFKFMLFKQ